MWGRIATEISGLPSDLCSSEAGNPAAVNMKPDPHFMGVYYFFPVLCFLSENGDKMLLHFEQKDFFFL